MKIGVVNQDSGLIGKSLVAAVTGAPNYGLNFNFEFLDSSTTSEMLKNKVSYGDYWGGLMVNAGASEALYYALNDSLTGYDPSSVCSYWYDQGRAGPSFQYSVSATGSSIASIMSLITKQSLLQNYSKQGLDFSEVSISTLSKPVDVRTNNLHNVESNGVHTAVGGGMMQLFLVSLIHAMAIVRLYSVFEGRNIRKDHLLLLPAVHRIIGSFIMAWWPPVVMLLLGVGSERITADRYFLWFLYLWLVMTVMSGMIYYLLRVFGVAVGALVGMLALLVQVAASTSSYPYDAMPDFYRLGYVMPFSNAVEGSRAILLGSNTNYLSRNIGVLFAWIGLFYFIAFITCFDVINKVCDKVRLHLYPDPGEEEVTQRRKSLAIDAETSTALLAGSKSLFLPEFRGLLRACIKKAIGMEIALACVFIVLLLITYGNNWDYTQYFSSIKIAIVNCDTASNSVISTTISALSASFKSTLSFSTELLTDNTLTYDIMVDKVTAGKYWAAVIVRSNATASLVSHLHDPSAQSTREYSNGIGALSFVLVGGRAGGLLQNLLKSWASQFTGAANYLCSLKLMSSAAASKDKFSALNAAVLSSPIGLSTHNMNAPPYPGVDSAISSAAMCLYLLSIVQMNLITVGHAPLSDLGIQYEHRAIAKALHWLFGSTVLSLWPTLSMLWLGLEMDAGMFFAYWALLCLAMCCFGAFIVMNTHLFGPELGGMINIIIFAMNQASSTSTVPLELQHPFFRLGLGLPFNQIVTAGRYILFGVSQLDVGRCVGVLIAWVAIISIAAVRLNMRRRVLTMVAVSLKVRPYGGDQPV